MSTLAVPAAVRAADAPAAQGDATSLQEIVVTASRSESTAQKTPVALTAYTGADLAQKGVSNVLALASVDASLNVSTNGGASYVAIRGIASTDVTETGDPSVPISRDNFFTNRSFSIATSMYDLERVEVLKGPQGTLFGRNSTGGLVQVITKKPGDKLSADASLEYGAYNAVKAEAGVSLPLSDKVQLRVAGFYSKHDGYRAIDVLGGRGDDDDTKSGRITLTFQPFDGLKGLIQYQHDDVHNTGDVAFKTLEGVAYSGQPTDHFANYAPSYNALVGDRVRWEFSYDLPANLTLFYAGGYDHQKWRHSLDASSVTGTGALAGDASSFRQEENPSTWNHEIRLATPQNGKLTAQVGYFHFSEHNGNLDSGLYKNSGTYEGQYLIHFLYDVKTRSDGVFGQFGWRPIDPLHITAGMRYTWDSKERTGAAYLRGDIAGFLPSFITTPIVTPGNGNVSEAKPTFHIGADWTFTPHSMAYAKFDTGFKSGGFNSNGSAPSVNYGPETLKAWEMGTKNKFLGGHLMVNADAFYQQYNGYQASQNTGVLSGSASGVFNVGAAEIYGMEAQLAVASHGWRLDANGTALKTRFTTHSIIVKGDNTTTVDLYGKRLPNAPTFVLTAGLEYGATLAGAKVTPRIEWKHSSSFYFDAFNDADVRQGQYDTFNASVMVKPGHSPFELMFFVRNLTNKSVYASAQENFVTIPNAVDTFEFQPPRTYGVRAAVHF
ncbi:MAG TPA: TonB-dependent receptor [Novosphingobium sp.]|nr:TonB-dependent receptor [Novosphingobium sp.]